MNDSLEYSQRELTKLLPMVSIPPVLGAWAATIALFGDPMRRFLLSVLCVSTCFAQSPVPSSGKTKVLWQKLEASIEQVDQHLDGVMGVAIEDLNSGDHYVLHED